MAAPHVAGVAALLVANGITNNPSGVRTALESTATDLGASGFDTTYGNGLVDAHAALLWTEGPTDDPPELTFTSPVHNEMVSGTVTLSADASDDDAVTEVNFYSNNTLLNTDTQAPYTMQWDSTGVSDGPYTLKVEAVDTADQTSTQQLSVIVENVNQAPVIDSSPNTSAMVDTVYSYTVAAHDDDPEDTVTYTLASSSPAGMSINPDSGLITWTPNDTQVGAHGISVQATDTGGLSDTQNFSIIVDAEPEDPEEPEVPIEQTVFSDSFENGFSQWVQDSQNDWAISTQRATKGSRSAELDGRATNATLTSLPIDLKGHTDVTISFSWLIERRFDSGEFISFSVSTDGGSSWSEEMRLRGNVDKEDVWHHESVALTGIDSLQIRYTGTVSKRSEDADVDNVIVTGQ